MKLRSLLVSCLVAAMPLVSAARDFPNLPGNFYGYADGKDYKSTISREAVMAGPAWKPSEPPPIEFDKLLELARVELHKTVKDDGTWEYSSFEVRRLIGESDRWYFVVHFLQRFPPELIRPGNRHGSFSVPLDFAGKPGSIEPK